MLQNVLRCITTVVFRLLQEAHSLHTNIIYAYINIIVMKFILIDYRTYMLTFYTFEFRVTSYDVCLQWRRNEFESRGTHAKRQKFL